ncbi:MAG: hypothetical protein ABIR70_07075 [Bryobacteraceae bacterium]
MKLETKKPKPSEFRQDLLRGIRWGTILLIAMLLTIAAYRVLSSAPATARETEVEVKATEEVTPIEAPIQVAEPVLKGPDAPAVPEPVRVRKPAPVKTAPQVIEEPQHLQAPYFAPLPNTAPKASSHANSFVAGPLPEVTEAPAQTVELPSPRTPVMAPPPDADNNSKQGNRAVRAVRSVGRIFRLGRKDPESKQPQPAK